jgi:hypothetical protein
MENWWNYFFLIVPYQFYDLVSLFFRYMGLLLNLASEETHKIGSESGR